MAITVYAPGATVEVITAAPPTSIPDSGEVGSPTLKVYAPGTTVSVIDKVLPNAPTFYGDWESGLVTGGGNRNWRAKEVVADDRIRILSDGNARVGTRYARIEVRSGDDPLNSGKPSDRAEVVHMQTANNGFLYENGSSGTQQYSFSVKFDPTWKTIVDYGATTGRWTGAWGIFLQLHGPNASNPCWALTANGGGHGEPDRIRFQQRFGNMASNGVVVHELSNGAFALGVWIDWLLTIKYAKDNTGWVRLERRDQGQASYTQVLSLTNTPTLQYDPAVNGGAVGNHYMKHGLYRNRQPFTSILYLDGFTRRAI